MSLAGSGAQEVQEAENATVTSGLENSIPSIA
jgi:hypothetical protein